MIPAPWYEYTDNDCICRSGKWAIRKAEGELDLVMLDDGMVYPMSFNIAPTLEDAIRKANENIVAYYKQRLNLAEQLYHQIKQDLQGDSK